MKVTQINGHHLAFEPVTPLGNARTFIRQRQFLVIEVKTDVGLTGWGEVFASPWAAAALIQRQMAPLVLGRSPLDHGEIHAGLLAGTGYDKRGPAMMAISALDLALHDLSARFHEISVAQLLGGAIRTEIPCYASGPFIREGADPYGHYATEIEAYLKRGFQAVKPRAGVSPRADGAMATQVRALLGDSLEFMVDINQGYSSATARQAARLMEPAQPLWIEEPVHPENLDGYCLAARSSAIPVAGGEAIGSLAGFQALLDTNALTVLQPDLTVCGGYTGYRKAAALAEARDIAVLPHSFGTAINFYASLQVAAATPTRHYGAGAAYPWIEYDVTDNPPLDLCGVQLTSRGTAVLPDGPGTGLALSADQLAPWTVSAWKVHSH